MTLYRTFKSKCFTLLVVLICSGTITLRAQTPQQIDVLNLYIEFLNKSIHGLFTAHALMVISNKEVNKYIDLESYELNNLSNSEVQSNLFAKSDKANYTTFQGNSPLELKDIARQKSNILDASLANKLNRRTEEISRILNRVNALRFEIFEFIETHDLNQKTSIYGVYELLEECADLFDDFSVQQKAMLKDIGSAYAIEFSEIYTSAQLLHTINKAILVDLRKESTYNIRKAAENFRVASEDFDQKIKSYNSYDEREYKSYVKNRLDSIYGHLDRFTKSEYVPRAYAVYGKYYYYHNQIAKRFFNWSGPGYVRYLNKTLESIGAKFIHFSEEPLIFKVVYPMKLDDLNNLSKEEKKVNLPEISPTIANPKFSSSRSKPDSAYLEIQLYDYNMLDRDTVSLWVNDELYLDKHGLKVQADKFRITMEKHETLKLELRADNEGIISPNTIAFSYRFKDQRKRKLIEKELRKGESIKLILENQ